jgi:hypothetical protein
MAACRQAARTGALEAGRGGFKVFGKGDFWRYPAETRDLTARMLAP